MIMTVTLTLAIRVIMIMIMIMVMKMKLFFFKVIQYLLTHGEMDPNVKDEILQVFSIKHF